VASREVIVAFDDMVEGTANVYSSAFVNLALGELESYSLEVVVDPVGTPPDNFTVQLEMSSDGRNWVSKNGPPEVYMLAGAIQSYVAYGSDPGLLPALALVRVRVQLGGGGASAAQVKVFVRQGPRLGFQPPSLPGCLLWLRSDTGITLNGNNPPGVSAWADLSGNGNNATQATGANQPPYVRRIMNGFPAIQGDGANYYMSTGNITLGAQATLLAVVQPTDVTFNHQDYRRLLEHNHASTYYLGTNSDGTKYKIIVDDSSAPFGTAEGGTLQLANQIVMGTYLSPTGTVYVNGTSVASDSSSFTTPANTSLPLYIMYGPAGANMFTGYMAEAIVYNRALSATEILQVHRYLGARYAVSVP
jgi:hypothetical protein